MRFTIAAVAACGFAAGAASAISGAEFDDFEGGTTEGWAHGAPSPNPPFIASEGSNNFLRVNATGSFGPGGRMAVFNRAQWTGDYLAAGVNAINFDVRNSGDTALTVRIGIFNDGALRGVTNDAVDLAVASDWTNATLDLTDLTLIGASSAADLLGSVAELRFVSASSPAFEGDPLVGTMDLDNIRAVPAPGALGLLAVGGLAGLRRRR